MIRIEKVGFHSVRYIWENYLWKDQLESVKPMSSMCLDKAHDLDIYNKYTPYFFSAFIGNRIIGVNSAHQTSNSHFRSRGLFVYPEFRRIGIGTALLRATIAQGLNNGCDIIWSYPRVSALNVYLLAGFMSLETNNDKTHFYVKLENSVSKTRLNT